MSAKKSLMLLAFLAFIFMTQAPAAAWSLGDPIAAVVGRKLVVATSEAEPFVIKHRDGSFSGIAIALWNQIANELGLAFEIREMDLPELLKALQNGSADVAVTALTVTSLRDEVIDFTQPYYHTGLGIALLPKFKLAWLSLFERLFSSRLMILMGLILLFIIFIGALVWFVERGRNPGHFGGEAITGFGSGLWWAVQTMSSVGYGDKIPLTALGRVLAFLWMLLSVVLISILTAAITSALTVGQLETQVRSHHDLAHVRVATVTASSSAEYMQKNRLNFRSYPNLRLAMQGLKDGEFDALVFDYPLLAYMAKHEMAGEITVLAGTFKKQNYAFGLPLNSPLRLPINQVLLEKTADPFWQDILYKYLGSEDPSLKNQ